MKIGVTWNFFIQDFEQSFGEKIEIIRPEDSLQNYDIIIFPGGEDISPSIYGKKNKYSFPNKKRDKIELKILEKALKTDALILGICRGHQLINAFFGAEVIQDIEIELGVYHPQQHEILKTKEYLPEMVNSIHHQGILFPGNGLKTTSTYCDIVESCESENGKILTVQFHPEFMDCQDFFSYVKEKKKC